MDSPSILPFLPEEEGTVEGVHQVPRRGATVYTDRGWTI